MFRIISIVLLSFLVSFATTIDVKNSKITQAINGIKLESSGFNLVLNSDKTKLFVTHKNGFSVYNVSDPINPTLISTYSSPFDYSDNRFRNNITLYDNDTKALLTSQKTVKILDISDLSNITSLGEKTTNYIISKAIVWGSNIILADNDSVSEVYSLANNTLTFESTYQINDTMDIAIDSTQAYLASTYEGLSIASLGSSNTLTRVSAYPSSGQSSNHTNSLELLNNKIYATTDNSKFLVFDTNGTTLGTYIDYYSGTFSNVEVLGNRVFLSSSEYLLDLNITDVSNITLTNKYYLGNCQDVKLNSDNTKAFVLQDATLKIINIETAPLLSKDYIYNMFGTALNFSNSNNLEYDKANDRLYISNISKGISQIDLSNKSDIREKSYTLSLINNEFTGALAMSPDFSIAYLFNTTDGVSAYDMNSSTITKIGSSYSGLTNVYTMVISSDGTKLFIGNYADGLKVIDTSTMSEIASFTTYNHIKDIYLSKDDSKLITANYDLGVKILDVSNLSNISLIADINVSADKISVSPDEMTLLVSDKDNFLSSTKGLHTYDISNMSLPSEISYQSSFSFASNIFSLLDDRVFLGGNDFKVVDTSDENNYSEILKFNQAIRDMVPVEAESEFYVVNQTGLYTLDITPTVFIPSNEQNPSIKLDINSSKSSVNLSVDVYDNTVLTMSSPKVIAASEYSNEVTLPITVLKNGNTKVKFSLDDGESIRYRVINVNIYESNTTQNNSSSSSSMELISGWNLVGLDLDKNNLPSNTKILWQYKSGTWYAYSPDSAIASQLTSYPQIDSITSDEGTWIYIQ